ncbi:MAG: hypothetical protein CMP65_01565 [Flavobacteriales bacterium]|nr:hypothetical protein [Flavobacteriales bacterium]
MTRNLKRIIFVFLFFTNYLISSQIDSVFVYCDSEDFNGIYLNYLDDNYINCELQYDGGKYNSKVRVRGSSSRKFNKKSLKIKFSTESGNKSINLNADYLDKSYMHQQLSSQLYSMISVPVFSCSHKAVFLNDEFLGIYLDVENVDDSFLLRNNLSSYGNLYKASKDYANLSMYDDADYYWQKKNNINWGNQDLKQLIDQINYTPIYRYREFIKDKFNYQNLISSVALNILIGNGSTYYHNYFLYHNIIDDNKWYYLPWDLDKTMSSYNEFLRYDYCSWSNLSSGAMPENPLIKKLFLHPVIFEDIKKEIENISENIFNPEVLYPIIDSLKITLDQYIDLDTTDQVNSFKQWEKEIKKIKNYIINRPKEVKNQINNTPTPFLMYNNYNQHFKDTILLTWGNSYVGNEKCNSYDLKISESKLFDNKETYIFKNIRDTFFKYSLPKGKYYWHINAVNGQTKTNGHNTRSFFNVGEAHFLTGTINDKVVLENKVIVIPQDLKIEKSGKLIVKGKSEIYVYPNCQILNYGSLKIHGDKNNLIKIQCHREELFWSGIYSEGDLELEYCDFSQVKWKSIIRQIRGEAKMIKCKATDNFVRESVSFNHCPVTIINNYFENNSGEGVLMLDCSGDVSKNTIIGIADAIEGTKCQDLKIYNNFITNSADDGIDLNWGKQIQVFNNTIINSKDKGISLTIDSTSMNNQVKNNLIVTCKKGVGIEGSGMIKLNNNYYINNAHPIIIENPNLVSAVSENEMFNNTFVNKHVEFIKANKKFPYKLFTEKNGTSIYLTSNAPYPIDLKGLQIFDNKKIIWNCVNQRILFPNEKLNIENITVSELDNSHKKFEIIGPNYLINSVQNSNKYKGLSYILLIMFLIIIVKKMIRS